MKDKAKLENKNKSKKEDVKKSKKIHVNKKKFIKRMSSILIICILIVVVFLLVRMYINYKKDRKQSEKQVQDFYNEREEEMSNHEDISKHDKLKEEKNIDGIILKDTKIYTEGEMTSFISTLYNSTGKLIGQWKKQVVLLDENGNELERINIIAVNVENKCSSPILTQFRSGVNVKDVYDFRVE